MWIAGRTPQGTPGQIDGELTDIVGHARVCLAEGCKPVVEGIGIEAHPGHSAIGLELFRGRILWADMQLRVPFWTLRAGEAERLNRVLEAMGVWLESCLPPAMKGCTRKQIREKLVQALHILRVNPYSHHSDFVMVAAGEMEDAQAKLDEAEALLNRWVVIRQNRPEGKPIQRGNQEQGTLPEVELEAERMRVRVYEDWHEITEAQTRMLSTLFAAQGAWVGGKTICNEPHKVRRAMPQPVADIINTDQSKGYRINPDLL